MRNRFTQTKSKGSGRFLDVLLPLVLFLLVGALFLRGIAQLGETTEEERLRSLEKAITRATVQCYAIEGRYAPNLEYLEDHYGLQLDRENFIIQYDIFASNIMPTIFVLPMGFDAEEEVTDLGF